MSRLAVVTASAVDRLVTRRLAFDAVRGAFEAVALGKADVCDVVTAPGLARSDSFTIKCGADRSANIVGLKCGSYWPGNFGNGLAAHGSTVLLLDPSTGFPHVLVSAARLNGFRTAAADAIAVSWLARQDATVLGVVGAGHQAEHEIRAVAEVRRLSHIKVYTRSRERADWLAGRLGDMATRISFVSAEEAVRDSDIVISATPSRSPIILSEWVADGAHVSAMGADAKGKQELEPDLLARARLFAEFPLQSVSIGEFQHALNANIIASAAEVCALGHVTLHAVPGRTSDDAVTVFDSSGIAIQDLAVARAVYEAACEADLVDYIDF